MTKETMPEAHDQDRLEGCKHQRIEYARVYPSHIRGSPVPARLNELTNGRSNTLGAIFISRGQVNFITDHDELTSDLGRGQNNSVRSLAVLAVLPEGLEDELWGCRTGEVKTNHLHVLRRALDKVMVLPEPGGPQSMRGLCSESHEDRTSSWRTVSMVGTTTSEAVTA